MPELVWWRLWNFTLVQMKFNTVLYPIRIFLNIFEAGVNILAQISQFFPDGNEKFTILPGTLFAKDMFGWILCSRICVKNFRQDILRRITISTSAHFLSQLWENSKMNFFWCRYYFPIQECLDGITFADFSGTVNFKEELILQNFPRLLILGSIIFQDFPGPEILRRIIITTSADSNSSPTQNFFPGCDIHLFARIFTPASYLYI